eukprot:3255385-Pyramimonas_sp.AAC.1
MVPHLGGVLLDGDAGLRHAGGVRNGQRRGVAHALGGADLQLALTPDTMVPARRCEEVRRGSIGQV